MPMKSDKHKTSLVLKVIKQKSELSFSIAQRSTPTSSLKAIQSIRHPRTLWSRYQHQTISPYARWIDYNTCMINFYRSGFSCKSLLNFCISQQQINIKILINYKPKQCSSPKIITQRDLDPQLLSHLHLATDAKNSDKAFEAKINHLMLSIWPVKQRTSRKPHPDKGLM